MQAVRRRLTYANVIATLALFLALSGGVVWASGRISGGRLKPSSVSAGKIKRNAVTATKIRPNAVIATKIRPGAVDFTKLAAGTNLIAAASTGAVPANSAEAVAAPLSGPVTFTPLPATVDLLSVEARGANLVRAGAEPCKPRVVPFVNGSAWGFAEDALALSAFPPTAAEPTGQRPVAGVSGPVGLGSPGISQTVTIKVIGDPGCAPGGTVSAAVAVTQAK
ncbi:MAG: hypothetical protein ACOYD4_16915 [Solirubrobacterales bacterium]